MIKNLLFACLTIFSLYTSAQNFVVTYSFADVITTSGLLDPTASPTAGGLTFGSFSSAGTSANPSASGRFSFTGWPLGAMDGIDNYSNFTGVLSPTVYYQVTISVDPGYTLSLNTATFSMRRSSTGIRNWCVRSDVDGYTNNLAVSTGTATKMSVIPGNVFFWNYDSLAASTDQKVCQVNFGSQLNALTNSITFRFYAWNAESSGGSFGIDNVSFMGSATNTVTLPNAVGIKNFSNEAGSLALFPNPVNSRRLVLKQDERFDEIEIISLAGTVLLHFEGQQKETSRELDVSDLTGGVYFLRIYSAEHVFMQKFVLEN